MGDKSFGQHSFPVEPRFISVGHLFGPISSIIQSLLHVLTGKSCGLFISSCCCASNKISCFIISSYNDNAFCWIICWLTGIFFFLWSYIHIDSNLPMLTMVASCSLLRYAGDIGVTRSALALDSNFQLTDHTFTFTFTLFEFHRSFLVTQDIGCRTCQNT
jgi:hypothetical protein